MENNFISKNIKPIELRQNNFAEQFELIFNIGGVVCPINTLIGLGIGAYNKKLAQDNLNILVDSLNCLISDNKLLKLKIRKLEKDNFELKNNINHFEKQIDTVNNYVLDKEEFFSKIKQKTEDELRNFSFNLQDTIDTTIKEKSKEKINKYAEYIVDTILDELIFTSNDDFKYILNVINCLNETDIDVLKDFNKSEEIYENYFHNESNYSIGQDKHLSVQKLIKLGLVGYDANFPVPSKSMMIEGYQLEVDKIYFATKFFHNIKHYLGIE